MTSEFLSEALETLQELDQVVNNRDVELILLRKLVRFLLLELNDQADMLIKLKKELADATHNSKETLRPEKDVRGKTNK